MPKVLPARSLFLELARDARRHHRHYRSQPLHRGIEARRLAKLEAVNFRISRSIQQRDLSRLVVPRPTKAELKAAQIRLDSYFGNRSIAWRIDKVDWLTPEAVSPSQISFAIFACSDHARREGHWQGPAMRALDSTLAALNLLHALDAGISNLPARVHDDLLVLAAAALNSPADNE